MKNVPLFSVFALLLASVVLPSSARADDKKKMLEWQMQQQQLQQQWKLQEVERQQQLLRKQQQAPQRNRAAANVGAPWGVNQNGRGSMSFTGLPADRLNSVVVTLNDFYDGRGNTNNGGSATITFYGNYSYPFRGTWSMQGNFTVGLNLTPAANAVRGDRATGNLVMAAPNGARLARITLTGMASGNPFTGNFNAL